MTQIRVLVVAYDMALRQSLEFALAADGYAVCVYPDIGTVPVAKASTCLVLDETGLAGERDEIAAFCARFDNVVVMADRPDGWVAALAQGTVAKPLVGGAVAAAVRSVLSITAANT